ncbi:basic amino acid/polyamine antiporter [Amycolatopsis mediterranei S699]|uniref:Basic amino acid/polyamine antiporter n=3 Tax=Amycolatopsis mediterranei TaxID=33910 RepID=A0A0H3D265_AMYMU|nr:basic amino acid/polyamine antiporter [Amycolatopsis mediterranei U32]AEK41094.1 basic amino acid/polyamine antiporter [Amycolatopsis mediterranei S699]AFO76070.1 basic amino acid/polyamine antiporter [Amycolatopsis mediterranei S699]AGT83199.1 basic amino acid/polyamine antiporter [Amycolatopsis mediterranei RB]
MARNTADRWRITRMPPTSLTRRLGLADAVFLGLGSMIGAGVFAAFAPAARAAGAGLLIALVLAAVVAYCNAMSSARLAAIYPESGGTYVYGRERLGEFWGYLAGWGFITGKTASCAAMTLTVVAYAAPGLGQPWRSLLAVAVVAALTAVNYFGVHRSALATRVIVSCTLLVLTASGVAMAAGPSGGGPLVAWPGGGGVLEAAGLLFFAFAGYARLATLGEEVRDPARTIPRAIPLALGITLVVYAALAVLLLVRLGPAALAASPDPIAAAVPGWLAPVVRVGAAVAALGSLLALILGVSRTTLAMSRDGHLPRFLAAVHPRYRVPHRAELAVGLVVAVLAATIDLRAAIGFSSFAVLTYYAIANAAALTLRGKALPVAVLGLAGCVVLAFSLPLPSVLAGCAALVLGCVAYGVRRIRR